MKGAQRREEQQFTEVVLHIMRQCVIQMPVVLGLEKNSPLQPNVNKYLRRLSEGGKLQWQLEKGYHVIEMNHIRLESESIGWALQVDPWSVFFLVLFLV